MLTVIHNTFGDVCKVVASVKTEKMELAYELTNSISSSWWVGGENVHVYPAAKDGCRSTSIGDIFYSEASDSFYQVDVAGYKEIKDSDVISVMTYSNDGNDRHCEDMSGIDIKSRIKNKLKKLR